LLQSAHPKIHLQALLVINILSYPTDRHVNHLLLFVTADTAYKC